MSEKAPSPIEDWHGPQLREAILPMELHNQGEGFDSNSYLYTSEDIGLMSILPDGGKTSVIGEVSLKSGTDQVENPQFAVVKVTEDDGTERYALGGLVTDESGRKVLNNSWVSLKEKEPITFGRAAENPGNNDNHLISASELWPERTFLESQGFSSKHLHVALVDGRVEVKDTSTNGSEIRKPIVNADSIEMDGDNSINTDPAQTDVGDTEIISKNADAVQEFIDLEIFEDLKTAHDALLQGFGGTLYESSIVAKTGVSNISERITHLGRLVDSLTTEELSGNFSMSPNTIINEIMADMELLENRATSIGMTEQHRDVARTIDEVSLGLKTALPQIDESAEPDNEELITFAQTGNQFASALDRTRGVSRSVSDMMPIITRNMQAVLTETTTLLRSSSNNPDKKRVIRQNLEAMVSVLSPISRELAELTTSSEGLQHTGAKLFEIVQDLKTA